MRTRPRPMEASVCQSVPPAVDIPGSRHDGNRTVTRRDGHCHPGELPADIPLRGASACSSWAARSRPGRVRTSRTVVRGRPEGWCGDQNRCGGGPAARQRRRRRLPAPTRVPGSQEARARTRIGGRARRPRAATQGADVAGRDRVSIGRPGQVRQHPPGQSLDATRRAVFSEDHKWIAVSDLQDSSFARPRNGRHDPFGSLFQDDLLGLAWSPFGNQPVTCYISPERDVSNTPQPYVAETPPTGGGPPRWGRGGHTDRPAEKSGAHQIYYYNPSKTIPHTSVLIQSACILAPVGSE